MSTSRVLQKMHSYVLKEPIIRKKRAADGEYHTLHSTSYIVVEDQYVLTTTVLLLAMYVYVLLLIVVLLIVVLLIVHFIVYYCLYIQLPHLTSQTAAYSSIRNMYTIMFPMHIS
jgi:hypothetical protein